MTRYSSPILDDQPTDKDALDFQPYVTTLVDVCRTASTPLTIGVFGGWGSGKTSLMRMIRKKLPKNYTIAWFDAWKYDNEETLWRAFLLSVLLSIEEKHGEIEALETLKSMLYRGLELEKAGGVTIDLAKLGAQIGRGAITLGLSFIPPLAQLTKLVEELQKKSVEQFSEDAVDAIRRERTKIYIEQVRSLEQFQDKFKLLVQDYVKPKGRLVVFVDDLDRCLPEKAIEVLEAIKLFVDAPECVFLLGLDHEVIARGVEIRYKEFFKEGVNQKSQPIDGRRYLEKIIQLPFSIPPVERADMDVFIMGLAKKWDHSECPSVFAEGLGDNPRQIKRTVNVFLMLSRLAKEREYKLKGQVKPVRLAKVVVIQAVAPELYKILSDEPNLLRDIEVFYRQEQEGISTEPTEDRGIWRNRQNIVEQRVQLSEGLVRLLAETPSIGKILGMHSPEIPEANFWELKPDEIRIYFTLTSRVEAPAAPQAEQPRSVFEPQMVSIPAGEFLMGSTPEQAAQAVKDGADKAWVEREQPQHKVSLSDYAIGRYPVTNREYQSFVEDAGYESPQGWSGGKFPEGKGDHPVINVSWEDAKAYCLWLKGKTGKPYRLPTEAEWEKAARGSDGLVYPWGNEWDPAKCNTSEGGPGTTTPVGQYSPQGNSPYICADMVGNVWEWCLDWFDEGIYKNRAKKIEQDPIGATKSGMRVVRGGSWYGIRDDARCAIRGRNYPVSFHDARGFRVVLSPIHAFGS